MADPFPRHPSNSDDPLIYNSGYFIRFLYLWLTLMEVVSYANGAEIDLGNYTTATIIFGSNGFDNSGILQGSEPRSRALDPSQTKVR